MVHFRILCNVSGGTRNSSQVAITLPFTAANNGHPAGFGVWPFVDGDVTGSVSANPPTLYISANQAYIEMYKTTGTNFLGTDLAGATPNFYVCGSYETPT